MSEQRPSTRGRRPPTRRRLLPVLAMLVGIAVVIGAGVYLGRQVWGQAADPGPSSSAPTTPGSPTSPGATSAAPWDTNQLKRFDAATALMKTKPGHIGIVVRDRTTGAVWRGGEPDTRIWASSTPKLALAVALREEARSHDITLDATANAQIAAMLAVSDNKAADALWNRYAKAADLMLQRFQQRYGMTSATYVDGFPKRWGFVKCTPQDLNNLASYVLDTLNSDDRAYIVGAMRSVGPVQQWGVWGAGSALQPGVKDGWSEEQDEGQDHWVTSTVGFVGPGERYVVSAMYHQPPGTGTIGAGVHALTDLVATVFGAPVPAPATVPPPD